MHDQQASRTPPPDREPGSAGSRSSWRPDLSPTRESGSARRGLPPGFFALWSTVAIDLIGFGIVVPLLPQFAQRHGASPTTIGLLVASFSLAQLLFAPVLGRLSDRVGRKPVLLVSLFGTALGLLVTGLAGSIWMLFAGRIIDGASGASVSVAQAAAADLARPADRPRLMGLLGAAFGVGFVAGPAIGALGSLAGPSIPFLIAAALAFANALVAIGRLPQTNRGRQGVEERDGVVDASNPVTATGETLAARGVEVRNGLVDASVEAERLADGPALDGPGLAEPAHLAMREPARADGLAGVRRREVMRLIAVAFVAMVAFAGFEATFALLGEQRFGFGPSAIGGVFTLVGLGLVAVQGGLVGPLSRRLGETGALRMGLALNVAGLLVLALDAGYPGLVVGLAALVMGQGLVSPALSSGVAGRAGRQRGQWLGWQQSAGALARVVGPASAGVLFEHVAIGAPFVVGAAIMAVAFLLVPG